MILSSRLIALESDECCCDKGDDPDEFSGSWPHASQGKRAQGVSRTVSLPDRTGSRRSGVTLSVAAQGDCSVGVASCGVAPMVC